MQSINLTKTIKLFMRKNFMMQVDLSKLIQYPKIKFLS